LRPEDRDGLSVEHRSRSKVRQWLSLWVGGSSSSAKAAWLGAPNKADALFPDCIFNSAASGAMHLCLIAAVRSIVV